MQFQSKAVTQPMRKGFTVSCFFYDSPGHGIHLASLHPGANGPEGLVLRFLEEIMEKTRPFGDCPYRNVARDITEISFYPRTKI